MKLLGPIDIASDGTRYIPVPCRGVVAGMYGAWETNAVEPGDTIIASRDTTAVNTITAVNTAGLVREVGVRDATNKDLVFDPDSATETDKVIKLVANGTAGISVVYIEYDEYATVAQAALEA
jgi:hypothetical protein